MGEDIPALHAEAHGTPAEDGILLIDIHPLGELVAAEIERAERDRAIGGHALRSIDIELLLLRFGSEEVLAEGEELGTVEADSLGT